MPWHIARSEECPASKPWAVIKNSDGSVQGCHETQDAAQEQMAALHANEPARGEVMSDIERRYTFVPVEVRGGGDGKRMTIGGYAAKFNTVSRDLGGFVETVSASFFNKSRGDGWPGVMARYNHNDAFLLGTVAGGTLRMDINDTGLVYEVDLPASRSDVFELVERRDVAQSSFAFFSRNVEDDWGVSDQGYPLRTLVSGRAVDVAPVNSPAYLDTSAALRSLASHMDADLEEVRAMAERQELIRFFKRSDGPKPRQKVYGTAALLELKAKEL